MVRRTLSLLVAFLFLLPAAAGAVDKDNPFDAKVHCPGEPVPAGGATELVVEYEVFSHDFFIYRDMSDILMDDPAGLEAGAAVFPKGKVKYDKVSEQDREIFEDDFRVQVPLTVPADAAAGGHAVKFRAKYQGCNKPENYCLFPAKKELTCTVQVLAAAGGDGPADPEPTTEPAAGDETPAEVATAADPAEPIAAADDDDSAAATAVTEPAVEPTPESASTADAVVIDETPAPVSTRPLGASASASDNCPEGERPGLLARFVAWITGQLEGASQDGGGPSLLFLLIVFLGGLASSLTPCVYPMIPITVSVIGASADQSRSKAFALSVVYVLGIAITYTVLGLAAAQSSGMFGQALQNPWVLVAVAAVMLALSLSMFGVYEFALPEALTTKASMAGGGGFVGAFVVGTVAGIVAAPCTGPIVILLLGVIGTQEWGVFNGGLVMLVYSLGLGMLFLAVGTFAGVLASMPRSGAWMDTVKHVFGVVIIGAAVYYAAQAVDVAWAEGPTPLWAEALVAEGWILVVVGGAWVLAGGFAMAGEERSWRRIGLGVVVLLGGLYLAVVPEQEFEPAPEVTVEGEEPVPHIDWSADYVGSLVAARQAGEPVILDFTADWCTACKELEHKTYTEQRVRKCAQDFTTVMIDGTTDTDEFVALKARYGIKGLPAVFFMCPDGEVIEDLTLKGFEAPGPFLTKMNIAIDTCREQPG